MPASRISRTSWKRLGWRASAALARASSSTTTISGRRATTSSRSKSLPGWRPIRGRRPARVSTARTPWACATRNHDIAPRQLVRHRGLQHGGGLADAGSHAQKDFQPALLPAPFRGGPETGGGAVLEEFSSVTGHIILWLGATFSIFLGAAKFFLKNPLTKPRVCISLLV